MSYNFLAEKEGREDLVVLHSELARYPLVEFFPLEDDVRTTALGVSIPFKSIDDPFFSREFVSLMECLIDANGFCVVDLFTGEVVSVKDLEELSEAMSR